MKITIDATVNAEEVCRSLARHGEDTTVRFVKMLRNEADSVIFDRAMHRYFNRIWRERGLR